ncbi:MAG: Fic family protein [Lachnospiraceae bacterium]|nr:Fic family protein [Lachnospiraceae bacterium]
MQKHKNYDEEAQKKLFDELISHNKLQISDKHEFYDKERDISSIRQSVLMSHPIAGKLNFKLLKQIHSYLFQDIYFWAGKDRLECGLIGEMHKTGSPQEFCDSRQIGEVADRLFYNLECNRYLQEFCHDQDLLCSNAAKFYGDLNYLHPFREGNGRTGRCFLNEIFRRLGFFFNACNIDKNKWDSACISSYTDQKASDLAALFKKEINVYPENKTKFIKYRKQFASEDFIETSPLDPIQFSDRTELLGNGGLGEKYSILKELIG